jgi:16S rRNA (uracil1498-N3)-methyltransferase
MRAIEPARPRFFVALEMVPAMAGATIDLPDAVAHHAVRVVRLVPGDALTLFTGGGGEYAATLTRADKRGAAVRIERFDPVERESPLAVTLAQGVAANDAMDYAVRKAVELGVAAIQPLTTARSAPLPSGERGERRVAHWRQIAIAACEQCGRNRVPEIAPPRPLAEWLAAWRGPGFALAPSAAASVATQRAPTAPLALLVGPEGGLDERELRAALERGFVAVRLGPRVLRTETAAVAALTALQTLWGDLR